MTPGHRRLPRSSPLVAITLLALTTAAHAADLALSLPLGPCYRPGKYLPVHVTAAFEKRGNNWIAVGAASIAGRLDIGKGAGRTSIELIDGRIDAVVPWLVMDARANRPRLFAEEPFESFDGPELRELSPNDRLVGWTTPDESFARELIGPTAKLLPVALDPAQPIRGNAAAWEMLDALVLDASSGARLDPAQLAGLLACGVTVAVKGDRPPAHLAAGWPWRRAGAYAVLDYKPAGPQFDRDDAVAARGYYQAAYAPVADWQAGWPLAFRRRVVVIAALCCVLILGLIAWRPPLTPLWAALLTGGMCVGIAKWSGLHLPIQQGAGEVIVINDALTQTDGWTYQTAAADDRATLKWVDVMRPIFYSRGGMDDFWMTLNCRTDGQPSEFYTLIPAERKVAFVSRSVGPRAPQTPPQLPVRSPLSAMVETLYLTGNARVAGELTVTPASGPAYGMVDVQQWNAVVIDRRTAATARP